MSDRSLILTLAKVIIAAAWADGAVSLEEINSLKDLLFRLPRVDRRRGTRIRARDWALLEMYIESPVDAEERANLVAQLQQALRTPKDRNLALMALEDLIQADGTVTAEERAVMEEIKNAIVAVDVSIIAQLGHLIRGPVQRRTQAAAQGPSRDDYLEDFIKNRIYYAVQQRLHLDEKNLDISDQELRKLSLAGGLMARVSQVDHVTTDENYDIIVRALQTEWEISEKAAALVAEVAISEASADLDFFRLTREFTISTTDEERVRFLDVLFAVANADDLISRAEISEIRRIASSLNLTRRQFVNARTKTL